MRYAVRLAYKGTPFSGWQSQKNAYTVQETIEKSMSLKYGQNISITGCCRTDKGVHAYDSLFHFDLEKDPIKNFTYSLNKMLPKEIVLKDIQQVSTGFHARFDAVSRSYIYKIHTFKDPFKDSLSFYYPLTLKADFNKMQEVANLLMQYEEFFPFCKTHTDVKTMKCALNVCTWIKNDNGDFEFHIKSNRFLRGMVRMIVGVCINAGLNKISIEEIKDSMNNQRRLKTDWSVPAHGLYLNNVKYLTLD
ncbi:MAG TPA: tRNA pseudouridine(38-40) synthase TruA [Bacteroidetes bacterium]|nr:tRNA pseudouridine(38-40) synthase TruA [Bacteroidota bacterium]